MSEVAEVIGDVKIEGISPARIKLDILGVFAKCLERSGYCDRNLCLVRAEEDLDLECVALERA